MAIICICGHGFDPIALSFLPIAILLLLGFCLGLSFILSAANVYMRDIQYLVNVLVMVWIWLTPIMYVRDFVDNDAFRTILALNPFTYFVELFQDSLYWMSLPSVETLAIAAVIALSTFVIGSLVYDRYSPDFAEVL